MQPQGAIAWQLQVVAILGSIAHRSFAHRRPPPSCDGPLNQSFRWALDTGLSLSVVLIPRWEQLGAGNLSDKLGAPWGPVIGSNVGARSLGAPGSLGAPQKTSLGAKI